ncbi:MAG: helix-turn-helix domain-containing protein [Pseudomonadota bacterium]
MTTTRKRLALLFHANNPFFRDINAGVASYARQHALQWDFVAEDLASCDLSTIAHWNVDGIVAECDYPHVVAALARSPASIVGVGSGNPGARPAFPHPFAGSDNAALVKAAYTSLIDGAVANFAMFSMPGAPHRLWALEREQAFAQLTRNDFCDAAIYRGGDGGLHDWDGQMAALIDWLAGLPKPVGVVAVCDARARLLLQACALTHLDVQGDIVIVGIDNDPVTRMLSEYQMRSVMHASEGIGRSAGELMQRQLSRHPLGERRVLLPPLGVHGAAAFAPAPRRHPQVMRALHYIRQHASRGIKSDQVADYVGISRSWLEHHFKGELGHTVHEEILRFKLEQARRMLGGGASNMTEVAVACGFTSVQYLYTVFARELGCTPLAWRERHAREELAQAA